MEEIWQRFLKDIYIRTFDLVRNEPGYVHRSLPPFTLFGGKSGVLLWKTVFGGSTRVIGPPHLFRLDVDYKIPFHRLARSIGLTAYKS